MILVDTSVWADHFRAPDKVLTALLDAGKVLMHPLVIGEIAMGYLKQRGVVLGSLRKIKCTEIAMEGEVLDFVERQRLFGIGIGYIDAHLLASVRLTPGASLWTRDKKLAGVAAKLGLATV